MKIVKYNLGNQKDYQEGKHSYGVSLVAEEYSQIRDNAIEACRMLLVKIMDTQAPGQYFMLVKIHPHHLMRENKSAAAVAGADRISTGMTQSFGVVIGRAALVQKNQELFFISCANEKAARAAKLAMKSAKPKVPCKTKVVFQKFEKK